MDYDKFLAELEDFKKAAIHLENAWSNDEGDIFGESYPKYLPSFDEFVADVLGMEPQPAEQPRHDVPALGTRVLLTQQVDRYPHFIAPEGWTGVVVDVSDGNISVQMDLYLGKGAQEWDNQVVFSSDDGDNYLTEWMTQRLSRDERAAVSLHEYCRILEA